MADADWPRYDVGPRECMFALGVVGVKYAQLEWVLVGMFATVTEMGRYNAEILLPRIRNNVRLDLMRTRLRERDWPADVKNMVQHFIDGFDTCADNRNLLMHSNVSSMTGDAIILVRTTNSGRTELCNPTLAELRQVADDTNAFYDFGMHLSNAINWNLLSVQGAPMPWPEKPPAPAELSYTRTPRPVRRMHQEP